MGIIKKLTSHYQFLQEKSRQKRRENWLQDMVRLYNELKSQEHVFIYSVCGRASSTALQRILNSSHEVCILGESRGTANLLLETIHKINEKNNSQSWKKAKGNQFSTFTQSFANHKHNTFYPNAFRDLDDLEYLHLASFMDLIRPLGEISRVGFKEIMIDSIIPLKTLKRIFPQSRFLFIFRHPKDQWNSIKVKGWWEYSSSVEEFLAQYLFMSSLYMEFIGTHNDCICLENTNLYNLDFVEKLTAKLHISSFDRNLIADNVNATSKHVVTEQEQEMIENSEAFSNYLRLVELASNSVY